VVDNGENTCTRLGLQVLVVSESFHTMVKHQKGGMASVCLNATINNISVLTADIFFV